MSNTTINSIPKAIKSISKEEWLVGGAVFLLVYVLVTKYWKKQSPTDAPTPSKPKRMVIIDNTITKLPIPSDIEEQFKKAAGSSYDKFISDINEIGLDKEVAFRQLWTESKFSPNIMNCSISSSAGAKGIAQFMPKTWTSYGGGGNVCNVADSLKAYVKFMRDLMKMFPDRIDLALAGYNSGPYIKYPRKNGKLVYKEAFDNKIPFSEYKGKLSRETQGYVAQILQP